MTNGSGLAEAGTERFNEKYGRAGRVFTARGRP
jgi:hypothetical protein